MNVNELAVNTRPDSYPPLKRLFSHPGGMFIRMLITSLLYEARRRHPGSFLTLARTERWIKLPKDLTKKLAPFEVRRRLLSLFSADGGRRLPFRTQTTDPFYNCHFRVVGCQSNFGTEILLSARRLSLSSARLRIACVRSSVSESIIQSEVVPRSSLGTLWGNGMSMYAAFA